MFWALGITIAILLGTVILQSKRVGALKVQLAGAEDALDRLKKQIEILADAGNVDSVNELHKGTF